VRCRKPAAVPPSSSGKISPRATREGVIDGHVAELPTGALDRVAAIATDPVPRPAIRPSFLMSV